MLRSLIRMIGFAIFAAFLAALIEHFYAGLSYTYRLWEDWKWVREQSRIKDLFLLDLIVYGIASGIAWMALVFLTPAGGALSKAARIFGMAVIILLVMIILLSISVGIASLFSIRVWIAILIFLLPVFLLNFFLPRPRI